MIDYTYADLLSTATALKALANENRLQILHWLSDPERHFPPQEDGDLVRDGVCVGFITEKIGLLSPHDAPHYCGCHTAPVPRIGLPDWKWLTEVNTNAGFCAGAGRCSGGAESESRQDTRAAMRAERAGRQRGRW